MNNINKNKKIGLGVVGVLVLVGAFYGGTVYGKGHAATTGNRGQGFVAGAQFGGGARGGRGGMGGFTTGEIIAKDDKSITLKLNGTTPNEGQGSKIFFLDSNTKVSKQADGTLADLAVGTSVSITGQANTDGSVNAQTVQIRPNMVK